MVRICLLLSVAVALSSCGLFSRPKPAQSISQTERFDTTTRTWVPISQAPAPNPTAYPQEFAPEESFADAQVLSGGAAVPGETIETTTEESEGLMDRVGRAATSPLRWVGLGKEDDAAE